MKQMTEEETRSIREFLHDQISTISADCREFHDLEGIGDREVYLAVGMMQALEKLGYITKEQLDDFSHTIYSFQSKAQYGEDYGAEYKKLKNFIKRKRPPRKSA